MMTFRRAGAMVLLAVITVGGLVALATGHYGSGLAALMIGGVGSALTITGWAVRRRRTGG